MKAAKRFIFGDKDERQTFEVGDEVPDKIVKKVPDKLILEKLLEDDPSQLTREQLLVLVGAEAETEEFNEEEFVESLHTFANKGDLVKWSNDILGTELSQGDGSREELELMVTEAAAKGFDEEE